MAVFCSTMRTLILIMLSGTEKMKIGKVVMKNNMFIRVLYFLIQRLENE